MSDRISKDIKIKNSNKMYSIIYCPEYASYLACDKRKRSSKILRFKDGIKVKFSEIELLPEPILWDGQLIRYQIRYIED